MKNRNIPDKDDWQTPMNFLIQLDKEFNFDFDPCPFLHDLSKWDGLEVSWGKSNFCNPPYSTKLKEAFVLKGIQEYKKGNSVVLLLPVSTSTKLFHDVILKNKPEIRFLRGRLKFRGVNSQNQLVNFDHPDSITASGQHDSMLVIFRP